MYISVGNTDPDFTSQLSPRVLARGGKNDSSLRMISINPTFYLTY